MANVKIVQFQAIPRSSNDDRITIIALDDQGRLWDARFDADNVIEDSWDELSLKGLES